jgi:hypothetical protein
MASHGVYLAACGFEIHGPRGHLGFAPKLTPEDFRCAFVGPLGWGSYAQKRGESGRFAASVELRHGSLRLTTLRVGGTPAARATRVTARVGKREVSASAAPEAEATLIAFAEPVVLAEGETLELELAT